MGACSNGTVSGETIANRLNAVTVDFIADDRYRTSTGAIMQFPGAVAAGIPVGEFYEIAGADILRSSALEGD